MFVNKRTKSVSLCRRSGVLSTLTGERTVLFHRFAVERRWILHTRFPIVLVFLPAKEAERQGSRELIKQTGRTSDTYTDWIVNADVAIRAIMHASARG